MSDRGTADQDPFQIWLATSQAFFAAQPPHAQMTESLAEKCEGLFAAWTRFAQTYAQAGAGGEAGGPFDPVGWLETWGSHPRWTACATPTPSVIALFTVGKFTQRMARRSEARRVCASPWMA